MSQSGFTISRQVSKIEERFQRKLENLRNYYAFKKFALVNVSESRTVKQAFKTVWKSSTLVKKIAIFTINVSKIEQSFQISTEFKLNEGIALSLKLALLF